MGCAEVRGIAQVVEEERRGELINIKNGHVL